MKETEVEIVERQPHKSRNKESFLTFIERRNFFNNRFWRFLILMLIISGLFKASLLTGYFFASSVYGNTMVTDLILKYKNRIPKGLLMVANLKGAFKLILGFFIVRFLLGIVIGWISMPTCFLANFYKNK